ncbi:MAG: pilin [Candidatus Magasanikbacteria bacterium]|nr:pilin [Candidatus Magasanikbacteria bacterium]
MTRLRKFLTISTILFATVFFAPAATRAAVCCVCGSGDSATIPVGASGQQIYDMMECGDHGSWGTPCSIHDNPGCTTNPIDTEMLNWCCVCTDGANKSVPRNANGEVIRDQSECNSHGEFGKPCTRASYPEECNKAPTMTKLEEELKLKDVVLGISIPNLQFSPPPTEADAEGNIYIPWLAEYIKAIYNFLVVTLSIVAVVMIIVAGAQIITSAGGPAKAAGNKRISQAVIGLLLAWGSYFIMYTINPNLTTFKSLQVHYIEEEVIEFDENYIGLENEGSSASSNPALEKTAQEVAFKLGINGCLFSTQIGKESNWKVSNSTGCCHGLGQIMLSNAKTLLSKRRAEIVSIHSQGCPLCPKSGDSDGVYISWLNSDAEGNLILAAMIKKNALKGAANPVAGAAVYGMGLASWKSYVSRTGCQPKSFDENALLTMLKTTSAEDILKQSCIPPVTWPLANQKRGFDCPPNSEKTAPLCCKSATGACEQPAFSPKGRIGFCQGGTRDGQGCAAVAGGETYIKTYLNSIKKCAQ